MRTFLSRLCRSFRSRAFDRQLEEELQFHLDMEAEKLRRRGMAEEEAASAARRALGGVTQTKENYRDQRGLPMMETFFKDLQYGLRMIRRSPGFAAIAVLSLALGIGANTAIFTLIDAVMLRSLPVQSPQELVSVGDPSRPTGLSDGGPLTTLFSYPLYQRLRAGSRSFTGLLASGRSGRIDANIDDGAPELVNGRLVSDNYFDVLGVPAFAGRTFTAGADRTPGASPVVVISYDYWERRFARDPAVLGRTLRLNGGSFRIIGIGPRNFTGDVVGINTEIWIPISMQPQVNRGDPRLDNRDSNWLLLMGRLKPGSTVAGARAEMTMLAQQALIDYKGAALSADKRREIEMMPVEVQPGAKGFSLLRKRVTIPLLTLMAVVALVLLIACANVANLLLARASSRQKEISVRLAVGASRSRLVRQLLTESALLALIGGAAGLLVAFWGSRVLLRLAAGGSDPIPLDVHPNVVVLAFTAGVSILTGIVFGLAPALRATRIDVAPALKENASNLTGRGFHLSKLLVVGQVALSLLLLVVAGLFVRSLANMQTLDVGYSRANLVLAQVDPGASGYAVADQKPMVLRLADRLRSVPGVIGVTFSENGIFSGTDSGTSGLQIDGFHSAWKEDFTSSYDAVGPHYFQVVGVPLLTGRDFNERDQAGSQPVVIINEVMARFYFGDRNPVGKTLRNGDDRYLIVGVARDMKERSLKGATERRFYISILQDPDRIDTFKFEIRTRDGAAQMLPSIRGQVRSFDRNLKILSLEPVAVLIDRSIREERLIAELSGFFGVLAVLLAATGLGGVMAYATSRRTNEIGIRMALGAGRAAVIGMVLRETLLLVALGIGIGLPATLAATRLVGAMLVGLSADDPPTFAVAALVMVLVAILAGMLPARRASRIDPMAALRQE
jgi:predicted permease